MKVEDLTESQSTNVLVCDIQPAYKHHSDNVVIDACHFLNKQKGKIVILFNGNGYTDDTKGEVIDYLVDNDLEIPVVERAQFIEKYYGFFRTWMDAGIDDRLIIKMIRILQSNKVTDIRQIKDVEKYFSEAELEELNRDYKYWKSDSIYLPDFMSISELKTLSPFYLIGGGRQECLREIELICNAFNIRYKRIDSMIY